jgi:HTH-type transcriptional regulator/antitoxin HigA
MPAAIRRGAPRDKGAALYMEMIARFPLRPLRSDRDLEQAAKIANALAIRDDLTQGETDYLDVLTDMIEKYENTRYPVHDVSGVELLRFLLSEQGKSQAEVARELGMSPSTISEILSGKRNFGRKAIETFSRYFSIAPAAFLGGAREPSPVPLAGASG